MDTPHLHRTVLICRYYYTLNSSVLLICLPFLSIAVIGSAAAKLRPSVPLTSGSAALRV
jgi:hypothetical protein